MTASGRPVVLLSRSWPAGRRRRADPWVDAQGREGDLAEALGQLDACGADAELTWLARDCAWPGNPRNRPRNASVVAQRLTAYLAGVQERLGRPSSTGSTAARVRLAKKLWLDCAKPSMIEWWRRLQVGLAASVLAPATVGGLATTAYLPAPGPGGPGRAGA